MTYTSDNIVGVEFTHKDSPEQAYKIAIVHNLISATWYENGKLESFHYDAKDMIKWLNNGTWIVKNSKV